MTNRTGKPHTRQENRRERRRRRVAERFAIMVDYARLEARTLAVVTHGAALINTYGAQRAAKGNEQA
jgi:hypothetical protein